MNIINKNQELQEINNNNVNFLIDLEKLKNLVSIEDQEFIQDEINKLKRINEDLTKGLYFVTIQGSLKTGKSTLTNLLIGDEIAITQAGVDTTKTPYVITKSNNNKAKILVYKLNKTPKKENDINKIIEAVLDDVKGIELQNNKWNTFFKKEELSFTKENIEKYTVNETLNNVLFINIQIPKPKNINEWILDHDIAILDTPGIEGKKANASEKIIKEIKRRTNMLIVMQSTVTPINIQEINALENYIREGAELRHMHNKFELKPWANEYDYKKFIEHENKAVKKGKEILKNELGLKEIISNQFNLAKVEDYMRNPQSYKNLQQDYNSFMKFVNELIGTINEIKVESKREKAIQQVMNLFERWQNNESPFLALKSKMLKDLEEIENEWNDIENNFEEFKRQLREFKDQFINKYQNKVNEYIQIKLLKETNSSLEIQNDLINDAKDQIIQEIRNFIELLNKEVNNLTKQFVLNFLNEEKNFLDKRLNDIKELLKNKNFTLYADKLPLIYFKVNDIPNIVFIDLKEDEINLNYINNPSFVDKKDKDIFLIGGFFKNRFIKKLEVEKNIKEELFQKQVINNFPTFIEKLESNIYNRYNGVIDQYIRSIDKVLKELKNDYERRVSSRKENDKKVVVIIEEMLEKIKEAHKKIKR